MCYDAAWWRGEVWFNLRAKLLWCIYDFLAYAMLAGTTNKGYCACPTSRHGIWSTCRRLCMVGGIGGGFQQITHFDLTQLSSQQKRWTVYHLPCMHQATYGGHTCGQSMQGLAGG